MTSVVSYAKFGAFVAATGKARVGVARSIKTMQVQEYQPGRDHYRAIRRAIVDGTCANSAEVLDTKLTVAVDNANPRRQAGYRRVAEAWRRQHSALGLPAAEVRKVNARVWPAAPVIRVNPAFGTTEPDGKHRLVTINYTLTPLTSDTAHAMLRLMQFAYHDVPDLVPTVVELQYDTVWTPAETYDSDFDDWLIAEAYGLHTLLGRLPGAAA